MKCSNCKSDSKKNGKNRYDNPRFKCKSCGKTYIEKLDKPLDEMRISRDKAILCLQLLVEGNSIRSTERITKSIWEIEDLYDKLMNYSDED